MPHVHPTVLVVDDNDDVREALALLVQAFGYGVEKAKNGREALSRMRQARPCVILLDLAMPDMTGEDFRREQLAAEDLREVPVVVVSAWPHVEAAAKRMNAAAWVMKPVEARTLADLVRTHCLN
jgi:FixJ family two-component response regulator